MWFLFPLLFVITETQRRSCESEGTCLECNDHRFSYYRCDQQEDCYMGELCNRGFCCPSMRPILGLQREMGKRRLSLAYLSQEDACPDGSGWLNLCKEDADCIAGTEVCAEGKCCSTCFVRRRRFLDESPSNEILGAAIPQCEVDGKMYRKKQCLAGTDTCWCVSPFGRRLLNADADCETRRRKQQNLARKAEKLREELRGGKKETCEVVRSGECPRVRTADNETMFCKCDSDCIGKEKCCLSQQGNICLLSVSPPTMTLICGINEQFSACHSPCQPSCDEPTTLPCPPPSCQPGCQCQPGYIRVDGSPRSACVPRGSCMVFDVTARCVEERRQYHSCGSACPISCGTRNIPRCHERCVSGCFCRVPYILENGDDPLNSRCILPSECPQFLPPVSSTISQPHPTLSIAEHFMGPYGLQPNQMSNRYGEFYITPITATVLPNSNHCTDPLKNFLSCGTKCPVGCNALSPSTSCSLSCVPGCFCHSPYILLDANDPQSACILPQHCRRTNIAAVGSCADPRKEWSNCGALRCSRSCSNPLGRCEQGVCSPGCICREPYILQDSLDPSSRCVLPSECERKCADPTKEFLTCGSSCPIGCDNRHPRSCTPCEAGCYCKNGLVFLNSSDWRISKCVRLDECPAFIEEKVEGMTITAPVESTSSSIKLSTTATPKQNQSVDVFSITENPSSSRCTLTNTDVGGQACELDTDCPVEQRCCHLTNSSLGEQAHRCACPDPHTIWSSCGSLCPEYCSQPAVPVCSTTCSPGCHCSPGFVKARNDITAPCIPREQCETIGSPSNDEPIAIMKEIPPSNPFGEQRVASAHLVSQSSISGRFTLSQMSANNLRISGVMTGLPRGDHAVVIHQFGDVGDGCTRIGPPFRGALRPPTLGDIYADSSSSSFSRVVDWPITDVIGRSIAIYRFPSTEWSLRSEGPLACGTIGLTARTRK